MLDKMGLYPLIWKFAESLSEIAAKDFITYSTWKKNHKGNARKRKQRLRERVLRLNWDAIDRDSSDKAINDFLDTASKAMKASADTLEEMIDEF